MNAEQHLMGLMIGVEAGMMHNFLLLRDYDVSKVVVELYSGQETSLVKYYYYYFIVIIN